MSLTRTSSCLKLLEILYDEKVHSKSEIASLLETNPRNVSEYVKELHLAGYTIHSCPGKNGGYSMKGQKVYLPHGPLSNEQKNALKQAQSLLSASSLMDPSEKQQLEEAVFSVVDEQNKRAAVHHIGNDFSKSSTKNTNARLLDELRKYVLEQRKVKIEYQKPSSRKSEDLIIHPYEIVEDHGKYYVLAYCEQRDDYRTYTISKTRMKSIEGLDARFERRPDFDLEERIGSSSIMKHQEMQVELLVKVEEEARFDEETWGYNYNIVSYDKDWLKATFTTDETFYLMGRIFNFGDAIKVLSPESLKQDLLDKFCRIEKIYGKDESLTHDASR